jgi:hypothetical protein
VVRVVELADRLGRRSLQMQDRPVRTMCGSLDAAKAVAKRHSIGGVGGLGKAAASCRTPY